MSFKIILLESNMTNYPHDVEKMCNDFLNLFENLIEKKSDVLKKDKSQNHLGLSQNYINIKNKYLV